MDNSESKKRKKAYYVKCAKNKKYKGSTCSLQAGIRGFLLTCNKHEQQAVREAYNILNEYADKLYEPVQKQSGDGASAVPDDDSEEDIEDSLEKELARLKEEKKSKQQQRFVQVFSGANNCVFIKTSLPDPAELAHAIYTDLYTTKKGRARHVLRFLPVSGTCRADEDAMQDLFTKLLRPQIEHNTQTYSGVVKVRNNTTMNNKRLILTCLRQAVVDVNPKCDVEYSTPDLVVHIDIIKTVCCIGILKDFYKFRKYNLQEVILTKESESPVVDITIDEGKLGERLMDKSCEENAEEEQTSQTREKLIAVNVKNGEDNKESDIELVENPEQSHEEAKNKSECSTEDTSVSKTSSSGHLLRDCENSREGADKVEAPGAIDGDSLEKLDAAIGITCDNDNARKAAIIDEKNVESTPAEENDSTDQVSSPPEENVSHLSEDDAHQKTLKDKELESVD